MDAGNIEGKSVTGKSSGTNAEHGIQGENVKQVGLSRMQAGPRK
jgi:hypothetical protein